MRRPLLLFLWLLSDYALFVSSFSLAYFLRVDWIFSSDLPFPHFMTAVMVSGIPWLAALCMTRTFSLTRRQRTLRNAAYIAYASVLGLAFLALTYFFLFQKIFSRELLLAGFVINVCATWAWHMVFGLLMRVALRRGTPSFPTLIVGVTRESHHLLDLLQRHRSVLKPVGIVDAMGAKEKEIAGVPVLGKLNRLDDVLDEYHVTHLIQCSDLEQSINLLSACRARGITYMLLPSVLGIVERDERVESLEGKAVTVVSPPRPWWSSLFR